MSQTRSQHHLILDNLFIGKGNIQQIWVVVGDIGINLNNTISSPCYINVFWFIRLMSVALD